MPREITPAEEAALSHYRQMGTPEEIQSQIKKLRNENAKHRTKVTELEQAAQAASKVPEGGRVLDKAAAERFDAFEALKVKPADVQAVIAERDNLKGDVARRAREDGFRTVLKDAGMNEEITPTLLALLPEGATVENRKEQENGKEKQVPWVTLPGEGAKPVKLTDLPATDAKFKGVRFEAPPAKVDGVQFGVTTGGKGKAGSTYDPAAEGKRMAEEAKKNQGDQSLALR